MPTSLMRTMYTYYSVLGHTPYAIPGYYPVIIYSEYGEEVENEEERIGLRTRSR